MTTKRKGALSFGLLIIACITLSVTACKKSSDNSGTTTTTPPTTTPPTTTTDPPAFGTPFASVPATKDIVMYEMNLRSMSNTFNFVGAMARLDSIRALGVNVIWIMPTYPIGVLKAIGSPYAVKDYEGVNTDFGTLADLRNFVIAAHTKGMAVIMDWVADHSAWDNAWIANTSWYKQDSNGNIISPSGFNDVAAFNFSSQPMRLAQISALKYWILTANIDGYRCDDADGPPADFWTQAIDTLKKFTNRSLVLFAEGTQSAQITAGFQMNNAFSFYSSLKNTFAGGTPASLFSTNLTENGTVPTGAFKVRYSTNHDDTSSDGSEITIYGGTQGATAAFVLSAYMSGVPEIYNGQEVGNAVKINFFNNTAIDWTINPAMTAEFKRIISIRANHEAIKTGNLTSYVDANVVAFEKVLGADDVLVMVNVRNTANTFSLPANLQNSTWINAETKASTTLGTSVTLQPYNYLILSKN